MADRQLQTGQMSPEVEQEVGDIDVVGVREKQSNLSENRLSIDPGGSWLQTYRAPAGGMSDAIPKFLRDLLNIPTTITIGDDFDAHHVKLAQEAIKRLASMPQFKQAYEDMLSKNLDIDFHVVTRSDQLQKSSDFGNTKGLNQDKTVSAGAKIDIYINLNRPGEVISDYLFQVTIMHELIHAFGNPQWSDRLDAPGSKWDYEIYNAGFSHSAQVNGSSMMEVTGSAGGWLKGTIDGAILVGSQSSDDIATVSAGNTVFSGDGDDRISISIAGLSDIRDDGGYDTLVVRDASDISSLSARWSSDGQDMAIYNDGAMIALLAGFATDGAFEAVQVGTTIVSLASLVDRTNSAPVVQDRFVEIHGTYQGLIGDILGYDPDGDLIEFRITEISGAHSDRSWRIDDGKVFADFLREDMPGNEFTIIRISAADGISNASMEMTVRWASDDSPNPELAHYIGLPLSPSIEIDRSVDSSGLVL